MKRLLCIILCVILFVCTAFPTSAHTPQNSRTYQSADDTGVYAVRFNGKHADITRYASHTLSAYVDVSLPIHAVCAYRGKIILLCDDAKRSQVSVYIYYLDTDVLDGFVINNAKLYQNIDFACDNGTIYIENSRDHHEILAYSYEGSLLGRYSFNSEVNAICGGYRSGIYVVSGDTLYTLSSGRFKAFSGDSVETPLFPADSRTFVSGYGNVYTVNEGRVTHRFNVDTDNDVTSACVIGNTLYYPNGKTINAYDLDTGEKIAYYQTSGQVISVYTDGYSVVAVSDSASVSIEQSDFTSLKEQDDDSEDTGSADGEDHRNDSQGSKEAHDTGNADQKRAESSSITSNTYQVDSTRYYISGISPQTTVAAFKKNMDYEGYTLTIYRGNAVKKSGNVGTSMTAVFDSDEYIYTYELAVTGDITGEGNRNSRDLNTLMDYMIGSADFNGVYMLAADASNDGKVDVCDVAILKSMI